ncbi:unnamed protein product, partial [Allacma fusca]
DGNKLPKTELDTYLEMKISAATDPLDFWRTHQKQFPNLARLAKLYLAIPATSASVERLFSELSALARYVRSRMTVMRQQECILYKEWAQEIKSKQVTL